LETLDCGEDDVVYQWYKVAIQPLYMCVQCRPPAVEQPTITSW